jgi:hypothetical protein
MQHLESATPPSVARLRTPLARWIRTSAAILLTLAAPAVSTSGALTTGLNGTSPAVRFPPGYGATLAATVAATALAAVLAALIARRDALAAIPVSLGLWAITGLSVVEAGIQLGHTGLTHWGIILIAASLTGAAAGMLLAACRRQPGQPPSPRTRRAPATCPGHTRPAKPTGQPAQTSAGRRGLYICGTPQHRPHRARTNQPGPAAAYGRRPHRYPLTSADG